MPQVVHFEKLTYHDTLGAQPFTNGGLTGESKDTPNMTFFPAPASRSFPIPLKKLAWGLRLGLPDGNTSTSPPVDIFFQGRQLHGCHTSGLSFTHSALISKSEKNHSDLFASASSSWGRIPSGSRCSLQS